LTGTGAAARRLLHDAVVPALLVLILRRVLGDAFSQEKFGIRFFGEGGVRITSQWAGRSVGVALPFGYSPTMLWILVPLCVLPTVWGFALWTLAGGIAARRQPSSARWPWVASRWVRRRSSRPPAS
jgi:hypothetical protein